MAGSPPPGIAVTQIEHPVVCISEPTGTEELMKRFRSVWWLVGAGVMAAMQLVFGFGNLAEDDGGPLFGQLMLIAVTLTGAALVVTGLVSRRRNRRLGSFLIGIGVLPSALAITLFWFPPAVLYGILAIAIVWMAFRDAAVKNREALTV